MMSRNDIVFGANNFVLLEKRKTFPARAQIRNRWLKT